MNIFRQKKIVFFTAAVCLLLLPASYVYFRKKSVIEAVERYINRERKILPYRFSLVVEDLHPSWFDRLFRQNFSFFSAQNSSWPAASIIKVPILACILKAAAEGKIDLEKPLQVKRSDISGGSGIIKGMKLPRAFKNKELLSLMIIRSDNTATNLLIKETGFSSLNRCFRQLGLKQTRLCRLMADFASRKKGRENFSSAADIAYLLQKIYKGEITSGYDKFMLSLLSRNPDRSRLGKYLPQNIYLAHKTGLERGVVHDGGIVLFSGGGRKRRIGYVIVIFTQGVKNYRRAKDFIGRLSQKVWEAYRKYHFFSYGLQQIF